VGFWSFWTVKFDPAEKWVVLSSDRLADRVRCMISRVLGKNANSVQLRKTWEEK
jgi:hypothetical protein